MKLMALDRMGRSLVVAAAAALLVACAAESSVGPAPAAPGAPTRATADAGWTEPADGARTPELGACSDLAVVGSQLAYRVYAQGVQIYRWNGTSWSFVAPSAVLSADAEGKGVVGTHYAGPTWESVSGSKVVASVVKRCTPDAASIPWLQLGAVSTQGPGIFDGIDFILRINTVGGNAPSYSGSVVNEEARIAYTADYLFYRAP